MEQLSKIVGQESSYLERKFDQDADISPDSVSQ